MTVEEYNHEVQTAGHILSRAAIRILIIILILHGLGHFDFKDLGEKLGNGRLVEAILGIYIAFLWFERST